MNIWNFANDGGNETKEIEKKRRYSLYWKFLNEWIVSQNLQFIVEFLNAVKQTYGQDWMAT